MRACTLFSTIAGKSQNLTDVRSEACAVDWFSCYPGYYSFAVTSHKPHVDEYISRVQADYKQGERFLVSQPLKKVFPYANEEM